MRKLWKIFLLAGVLGALFSLSTLAAESTSGIYDAAPTANYVDTVTIAPQGGTAMQVEVNGKTKTVYVGAEKLSLKYTGAVADKQYLVLALNNDSSVPTADNIVYIDQNGTAEFTIYPSKLQNGTYHIYMSGTDMAYEEVASFHYFQAYKIGDADDNQDVDVNDAVAILKYIVGNISLTSNGIAAADANEDGSVDVNDVVTIMKYIVGNGSLGKQ